MRTCSVCGGANHSPSIHNKKPFDREKLMRVLGYLELQGYRSTALGLLDLANWYSLAHVSLVVKAVGWLRNE